MIDRRGFLKLSSAAAAAGTAFYVERKMAFLQAAPGVTQPLQFYPNRNWERIYRDQYAYDSSFTFVCAPNCTHNCRLRAFVRNGVVIRTEQNYDAQAVGDLDGNFSTNAWNPRGCNKGAALTRRIYGPYRLKGPMIRAGWKRCADDGFPDLTAERRMKYKFDPRVVGVIGFEVLRRSRRALTAALRPAERRRPVRLLRQRGAACAGAAAAYLRACPPEPVGGLLGDPLRTRGGCGRRRQYRSRGR